MQGFLLKLGHSRRTGEDNPVDPAGSVDVTVELSVFMRVDLRYGLRQNLQEGECHQGPPGIIRACSETILVKSPVIAEVVSYPLQDRRTVNAIAKVHETPFLRPRPVVPQVSFGT